LASRVMEKLNSLGKKPLFFPLFGSSTPFWPWKTIFVEFGYLPKTRQRDLRVHYKHGQTIVMVESGGLSVDHPHNQKQCLHLQSKVDPDLVLTLDYPVKPLKDHKGYCRNCGHIGSLYKFIDPYCPDCGGEIVKHIPLSMKKKRVEITVENAKLAMEWKPDFQNTYSWNFELVGVIQGFDRETTKWCAEQLHSFGYEFYAFGAGKQKDTKERLGMVRDIIGQKSWLHLLGITEIDWLIELKGLYDSFDSATCTVEAKNARMILSETGKSIDLRKSKEYSYLVPEDNDGYLKLQMTNFRNYAGALNQKGINSAKI
jgi:queuine/archaeosine tRNA-ribosyltransferase